MKKTSLTLIFTIIISIFSVFSSSAEVIDEKVTVTDITKGVTHTHIERFTTKGMYNINYMKLDLNEPHLSLKVLSNKDTRIKSTVLQLAKNEENVVGAINADFFTSYSQSAAAEGMMVKDGNLITTPSNDKSYATFTYDENKTSSVGYFTYILKVTSERTMDTNQILFYNKNADAMYLKLYDRNFGAKTPGSMNDGYEVVVEDGVVTNVLSNTEGVEIPENGYVLHNSLRHSLFLMENFQIGDKVKLELSISPEIDNIKEAAGGGTVLLKNGEKAEFSLKDTLNPVTAVGIDKTGKILYFLTVDGRSDISRGMTFSETADFLKELGCFSAMSFDGGGSTQMVGKMPGKELENLNYQSYYRPVINGISVVSEKMPLGKLKGISLSLSQESVYKGLPLEVYIDSAYDEYGNAYDLSKEKISYKADKKGSFIKNVFYPKEAGEVEITVTTGNVSEKIKVYVIDNAKTITATKEGFELKTAKQSVSFNVKDENGYSAYIPSDYLNVTFENAKGTLIKDGLTLSKLENGSITVSYEDATLTLPIGDYEVETAINDRFYKPADKEGFEFGIFGINTYSTTLFSNYITGKRTQKANLTDLAALRSIPDGITVPTVKVTNYGREDTEHSLFLKLDNSKGGIAETKSGQWEWLLDVFKKGVKQKNIFVTLPLSYDKNNKYEAKILSDKLKENLPDKNIFIISYGDNNTYEVREGIRYITVMDIPKFSKENAFGILGNLKYAHFTITEDDVCFEFRNILD